jgi:hypothetical protein
MCSSSKLTIGFLGHDQCIGFAVCAPIYPTGISEIKRLSVNMAYLIKYFLRPLEKIRCPEGRKIHERRVMVHFANTLTDNMQLVREHLTDFGLKRMEYSA